MHIYALLLLALLSCCLTVWKFKNFSTNEILREISFRDFKGLKKFIGLAIKKAVFETPKITKIDVT